MNYHIKTVDLNWDQVDLDLACWKNDNVYTKSVVGTESLWNDNLSTESQNYKQCGYTEHNTRVWKSTNLKEPLEFNWQESLISQLPIDHGIATLTRQDPGQVLPWHVDKFYMLRRLNPSDPRMIVRFLIFFQDWDIGHLLQIGNDVLYNWKRGDVYVWTQNAPHVSANIGLTQKWTCNVTGFLTDSVLANKLTTP